MYRLIGVKNRLVLFLVGLVLVCAAAAVGLLASPLRPTQVELPASNATIPGPAALPDLVWLLPVIGVAGLVLALLGVAWLVGQVPRTDAAKPLRLHQDPASGTTLLPTSTLTRAIETQTEALPGVTDARALLRGSARAPELTLRVTAEDRAELAGVLGGISSQVAADLATSLETSLNHLAVQIDIGGTKAGNSTAVL